MSSWGPCSYYYLDPKTGKYYYHSCVEKGKYEECRDPNQKVTE